MSVFSGTTRVSGVKLIGLDEIILPFVNHISDGIFGEVFTDFQADNDDKYVVKAIDGLNPPDQTVAIARTASGGQYQGKSPGDRELVFLIGLYPDYDAGETPKLLRDNLYAMINTGYDPKVTVQLLNGLLPHSQVDAYVTKFEADLFTKDPVVQITFTCLNPTFSALGLMKYSPDDLDLKFPNIYNPGTAETGFQFAVKFTVERNNWFIKTAEDQNIGMRFLMHFNVDDVLSVSTVPGSRYIHWNKKRGKVINKMGVLSTDSEWLTLHPGMNHFVVPVQDAWVWLGDLSFTSQYWGV